MSTFRPSAISGFSIVEVLVMLFIVGILGSIGFGVYKSAQAVIHLETAAHSVALSLRRAQVLAQSSEGDSRWGVKIQKTSVTVFKGDSFATRSAGFDEQMLLSGVTVSGADEIIFSKLYGNPASAATTTITGSSGRNSNITINEKGAISY